MALNPKRSNAAANAAAEAMGVLLNNGYLRIYDGVQATNADTALGAQVLLAELRFGTPAFAAAVNGQVSAYAITADASANATGTATWFRAWKSDGTTVIFDGSVGTSGCDLNLNTVAIAATASVTVSSLVLTETK